MNLFVNAKLLQTKKVANKASTSEKFKAEVIIAIGRFFNNDWGDVCNADKVSNEEAIPYYEMVVALYETSEGDIWITGESSDKHNYDKVVIAFPDDY